MKKIKNTNEIVEKIVTDYRSVFGADLVSIFLYGSAAGHEYRPGKSDINLGVVLTDNSIARLHECLLIHKKWRTYPVATPFYLTKAYINASLDTFPVEFLDIKSLYRTIYGEDVIADLPIRREYLRLQCERELKGIALHLRKAYIETGGRPQNLLGLLALSFKRLLPIFKAVLMLHDMPIPKNRSEIVLSVETIYKLGSSALSQVYARITAQKSAGQNGSGYLDLFNRYAAIIDTIGDSVDRMSNN